MKKSIKLFSNFSTFLGIIFVTISIAMSFTPLFIFGYYPLALAIVFAVLAYFISKKNNFLTKIPIILIILTLSIGVFLTIRLFTQENKISNDEIIEQVVTQETEETVDDLDDALENLD